MTDNEFVRDFNIGTTGMHTNHRKEMMMESGLLDADRDNPHVMGKLRHDDTNSVLPEPDGSAEIVWNFSGSESPEFVCNVPGHYESGMVGAFEISQHLIAEVAQ